MGGGEKSLCAHGPVGATGWPGPWLADEEEGRDTIDKIKRRGRACDHGHEKTEIFVAWPHRQGCSGRHAWALVADSTKVSSSQQRLLSCHARSTSHLFSLLVCGCSTFELQLGDSGMLQLSPSQRQQQEAASRPQRSQQLADPFSDLK